MGIRYYIDYPCVPREELGPEELERLVFLRDRAGKFARLFRETKGVEDEERMIVVLRRADGEEVAEARRSVSSLREESAALVAYEEQCEGCPANVDEAPFGCHGVIAFPVSLAAEEWLAGRLAPEGTRARSLFDAGIEDHGYGSDPRLAEWRRLGFIERPEPLAVGEGATTDALLHELLLPGEIGPEHGLGLLLQLGALRLSDGTHGDAVAEHVARAVEDPGSLGENAPGLEFAIDPYPMDDASIRDLKRFLFAVYMALSQECPVRVTA
ncbi:MAG: hypothetical protein SF028_04385 [Candidatus Sumerlaeia bacterium]|nr:hypothetical protein [Candidatus Sumerlaeia bacterium]